MKCTWAPLEKPWSNVVARYCVFVSRHPWPFIIIPMILCICLSSGVFMHFRIVRGVHYLYSPLNAPWKTEEAVFGENWANDDIHYHPAKDFMRRRGVYMIITAKDKGSILRKEHARQFLKVLEYIGSHNLTSKTGRKYSYKDICLHFQNECFSNSHGRLIADIFARGDEDHFNITYPKWASRYATEKIDVMRLLGNVSFNSNGYVNGASAWMILYQLKKFDENVGELSKEFENAIAAEIENGTLSAPLLNIYYFHSATFDQELAKEQDRIIPKFSITFCVLIVFSVLTTFTVKWVNLPGVKVNQKRRKFLVIDWVLSKPLLGIVGVISTLMAIISATGMLLLCGVTFVDMCTVMPFLSLTIGIDDTFLMLAAWHETNRLHSVEERVETAMRHAAVSISITTLTDCIAFLIGASAPLPAVMFFCYYSSAAIFFIFLYCMTVFVATLSLQGRIEEQERNSLTLRDTINLKEHFLEDVPTKKLLFHMGTHVHVLPEAGNNNDVNFVDVHNPKKEQDHRMWYQRFFEDKFGPFISKPWMTAIFFGLYIVYASFAIYGISNLVIGFDLINVVQKSTSPRAFLTARNSFFPMDSKIVDIAVMKPPNMAARKQREEFFFALQEFETTWCSSGRNSTDFWYFSFQDYMKGLGFDDDIWNAMLDDEESFVSNLGGFLMANDKYSYDVLRDENGTTKAFRLATRVTNVATDSDINLCKKYSNFEMATYTPLWNIADEYEIMWPQTMQDLYFSIIAMLPVSLLFIPQPLCVIVIGINIFSIAFGVLGFMTFIDISLDAISMITIAMSVGFSVDFAAHVSYAYMTEKRLPKKDENIAHAKLRYTLGTVGWPIIQASISVLLGISSLAMVDSYVVQTCFKTVLLVIFFGTAHALIFLPLSLMAVHRCYLFISMARESGGTASVAPTRNGTSQSNQNQINQAENEAETSTHQNEQQTSQSSNSEPKKSKGARKSGENSSIPGTSDGETTASGNAYQHTDLKALQSGNKGALKKQPIQQQQAEENHEEENPDNELEELCVDERMDREQSEELIEEDRHSQSAQMQGPFKLQSSLGDYQFMIALADAVSLEPCIYDPRDEHYGNRMASVQFRTHVWQSISEQINFTGTIQQLQTHWKRLRDKYVRWKKKTEREQRNSDPMDVEMMERMHWLDEYCGEASARGQSILRQQLVHSTESMNADTYYDNHNMSIAQDLMISGYQTPRNISIVQGAQSSRLSHQNESPSGSASGAHSTSAVTTSSSNGSGYILLQPNSNRPVRLVPLAEASGIISNVNDAGTSGAKTMTTLSGNNSGNVHHSAITNKGQRIIITGGSSATKSAHNSEPTITVTDSGSVPGRAAMTQQPKKEPVQLHHHGTMTMLVDTTTCYQNGSGQKMFRLLSVPNTPSNPIEYESPAGSTSSGSAGPPPVKKRLIPYRPNNASNHQYTPTSHQNVATTSAQHSQSIVLTNSGHAARNSSGSGAGQRILIPQQTISQSHSSGGLSQLNEDMILDEADSLQDRSIVMDQDEDSALLGESPLLSSMMIGGGHEQLRGQTSNEAEQHHRLAVQQQQRLVANSPSVGAGPSATVGYQSQYDADLAFQQLISSHLSRLADDEKAVMKMNIQRILLDARFGPGTCIRIIQDEETELPTNNVVAHELVPNSH